MGATRALTQKPDGTMAEALRAALTNHHCAKGQAQVGVTPTARAVLPTLYPLDSLLVLHCGPPAPAYHTQTPLNPSTCAWETATGRREGLKTRVSCPNGEVTLPSGTSQESVQAQSHPACPVGDRTQASYTLHPMAALLGTRLCDIPQGSRDSPSAPVHITRASSHPTLGPLGHPHSPSEEQGQGLMHVMSGRVPTMHPGY